MKLIFLDFRTPHLQGSHRSLCYKFFLVPNTKIHFWLKIRGVDGKQKTESSLNHHTRSAESPRSFLLSLPTCCLPTACSISRMEQTSFSEVKNHQAERASTFIWLSLEKGKKAMFSGIVRLELTFLSSLPVWCFMLSFLHCILPLLLLGLPFLPSVPCTS